MPGRTTGPTDALMACKRQECDRVVPLPSHRHHGLKLSTFLLSLHLHLTFVLPAAFLFNLASLGGESSEPHRQTGVLLRSGCPSSSRTPVLHVANCPSKLKVPSSVFLFFPPEMLSYTPSAG
ncbi:hypothetical protein B0H19DRAFT_1270697 [Mycena capillaripes]|nr:hypothetical protein B0H19DRAFT_1270697 [Mycena capillaripes]